MAQTAGKTFLPRPLMDSVTARSEDHRALMNKIDQGLQTHDTTLADHAAQIAALQAQIANLLKKTT